MKRTLRTLEAVLVAVGGRPTLIRLIRRHWNRYTPIQERPFVLSGLFPWEEEAYNRFLPPRGRIGIIGCGAGRDTIALVKRGYEVEGVDLSPVAIEKAKGYLLEAGVTADLYVADAAHFEFPGDHYDAFLISHGTYSYIPGPSQRVELLGRLAAKISPNGVIVSIYHRDSLGYSYPRFSELIRGMRRFLHPKRAFTERDRFNRIHYYFHGFSKEEFEAEARAAGLVVTHWNSAPEGVAVMTPGR